jgi:hypothetical protein
MQHNLKHKEKEVLFKGKEGEGQDSKKWSERPETKGRETKSYVRENQETRETTAGVEREEKSKVIYGDLRQARRKRLNIDHKRRRKTHKKVFARSSGQEDSQARGRQKQRNLH